MNAPRRLLIPRMVSAVEARSVPLPVATLAVLLWALRVDVWLAGSPGVTLDSHLGCGRGAVLAPSRLDTLRAS